ncbi:MAG: sensor histidine kinase [Pseudonocardia sp.]|nr:sensor histidine kinase [Pseudonocardia sp.]
MTTGTEAGHRGYRHETAFYGWDEEYLSIVVPFLNGATQAGEPAVVAVRGVNAKLIHGAVQDPSSLSFIDADLHYGRPSSTIKAYRDLLTGHVANGAEQIRLIGEVPHPGVGRAWDWWARYEAAINHAYDDFPLWCVCPYDTRITPGGVLADVARTHPFVATADGSHAMSGRFEDPARFLRDRTATDADPLEAGPPAIDLVDPTPGAARRAVRDVGRGGALGADELDDLVMAVNEAVTNALRHGRPPVHLRVWPGPDRVVAAITDGGSGPADPFAGLLPATATSAGGLGLWLTHEICSHITLDSSDEGFTIRLVAGKPCVPSSTDL